MCDEDDKSVLIFVLNPWGPNLVFILSCLYIYICCGLRDGPPTFLLTGYGIYVCFYALPRLSSGMGGLTA